MSRFLACLLDLVTRVSSSVARVTSRRGKPRILDASTVVIGPELLQQLADDYARKVAAAYGSSSPSARTAPQLTAGTTAVSTTTAIGGSRAPGSGAIGPFGMCIYPERKTRPASPGIDTEDPDA